MSNDTSSPPESFWEWQEKRRRAAMINPDKPADPVTVTLTAEEARQLSYMAEGWLDELSPSQVYAGIEAGVWDRETVFRAFRKIEAAMWPVKPRPPRKRRARDAAKQSGAEFKQTARVFARSARYLKHGGGGV